MDGQQVERSLIVRFAEHPLGALMIALLLFAFATAVGITIGSLTPALRPPIAGALVKEAVLLGLVLATYKFAIVRLGVQPRDDLPGKGSLPDLGKGIAAGALIFSLVVGAAAAVGVYRVVGRGDASGLLPALVSICLVPAFMEELLFRGILFRWIEEFAGSWGALLVTSALFGLAHIFNPGATWFSTFAIAVEAGLLLGGAYMLTRSLWMPIGLHAAWNFTQGEIFGVPVSGGASQGLLQSELSGPALLSGGNFGLEASLFAVVIATAAGVTMVWLAVRNGQLIQPRWKRG